MQRDPVVAFTSIADTYCSWVSVSQGLKSYFIVVEVKILRVKRTKQRSWFQFQFKHSYFLNKQHTHSGSRRSRSMLVRWSNWLGLMTLGYQLFTIARTSRGIKKAWNKMPLTSSQEKRCYEAFQSFSIGLYLQGLRIHDMMPLQAELWQSNHYNFIMNFRQGGKPAGTVIS